MNTFDISNQSWDHNCDRNQKCPQRPLLLESVTRTPEILSSISFMQIALNFKFSMNIIEKFFIDEQLLIMKMIIFGDIKKLYLYIETSGMSAKESS